MKITKWVALAAITLSATINAGEINIQSAEDWGNGHSGYPASNAIDGSLSWASRWAASGSPVNLQLNIGSVKRVSKVGVAWGLGDNQSYEFEI